MSSRTAAVGLLLALPLIIGLAGPAGGDPLPDPFDALEAELVLRRDNDFGGDLDREAKKRLKAVTKGLAQLAKRTGLLLDDTRIAGRVEPPLAKAYADEFGGLEEEHNMGILLGDLRGDVVERVDAAIREFEPRQSLLQEKTHGKVRKQLEKASDRRLDALFARNAKASYRKFGQAAKAVAKCGVLADRDAAPGPGRTGLRARIVDSPFEAATATAEYDRGSGNLLIEGSGTLGRKKTPVSFSLLLRGVFATGPFTLDGESFEGTYEEGGTVYDLLPDETAFLTVTILDADAPRVAGVFDFRAEFEDESGTVGFPVFLGEFQFTAVTVTGGV